MEDEIGRREANKRATRTAIQHAAKRLFAERGYDATTVREIAQAAEVTERTFYRYFEGKEGLIANDAQLWVNRLTGAIRDRPRDEGPLLAVRRAMVQLAHELVQSPDAAPIWLFGKQPRPFEVLQRSGSRPLLRFEQALTEAVLARSRPDTGVDEPEPPDARERFNAELVARVSIAVLRTAAMRRRQQPTGDVWNPPPAGRLLEEAFETLSLLT